MPPPPKHHRHRPASSRALAFVEGGRIDDLLRPFIADDSDRAFVTRCVLEEGPLHHRGANYLLLALLGEVLTRLPGAPPKPGGVTVRMRLPPHLAERAEGAEYPLPLATGALERLAQGDAQKLEAMVDALTDGPPQHALANVAMTALLELILDRLEAER